jgi:hypothetical protein
MEAAYEQENAEGPARTGAARGPDQIRSYAMMRSMPSARTSRNKDGKATSGRTRVTRATSRIADMPLRAKQKRDHVGGPGASLENRKEPQRSKPRGLAPEATKSTHHSGVSGGGGEQDRHHSHDTRGKKGG